MFLFGKVLYVNSYFLAQPKYLYILFRNIFSLKKIWGLVNSLNFILLNTYKLNVKVTQIIENVIYF